MPTGVPGFPASGLPAVRGPDGGEGPVGPPGAAPGELGVTGPVVGVQAAARTTATSTPTQLGYRAARGAGRPDSRRRGRSLRGREDGSLKPRSYTSRGRLRRNSVTGTPQRAARSDFCRSRRVTMPSVDGHARARRYSRGDPVHPVDQGRECRDPIGRHAAIVQIGQILFGRLEPSLHVVEPHVARGGIGRRRWMRIVGSGGGRETGVVA